MTIQSELMRISSLLKGENIPHDLIGGLAVGFLGVARFTNDIDLLIDESDRKRAVDLLLENGYFINGRRDMTPIEYLNWLEENWDLFQDNEPRPDISEYEGEFRL